MVKENSFEVSAFGSLHDIFDPYRTVACLGLSDLSISLWMGIYLSYSIGVIKNRTSVCNTCNQGRKITCI
jgi:hypothetical protein